MDYTDYLSVPTSTSTDFSPSTKAFLYPTIFDEGCMSDPFTVPKTSLATFDAYFGSSLDSVAPTTGSQLESTSNLPLVQQPFGQLDAFSSGFPWDMNSLSNTTQFDLGISPLSDDSPSPSVSGNAPQNAFELASPPPSPYSKRRSSSISIHPKSEDSSDPPKRRRGRPRLNRASSQSSTSSPVKTKHTERLPHNQVERKYREGLNAALERLRKVVPSLCAEEEHVAVLGHPRASKAMVLDGAIEYIRDIEKERDGLRGELEMLRQEMCEWEEVRR